MYLCKLNIVQEFSYNSPTHRVPLNCQMTNSHAGSFLPLTEIHLFWLGDTASHQSCLPHFPQTLQNLSLYPQ